MSSKKFDKETQESSETQTQDQQPQVEDWRPDYFPTSAKPVFKKTAFLVISILFLCVFLGYCSKEESTNENTKPVEQKTEQPEDEEEFFE